MPKLASMTPARKPRLHLAATPGGHLDLMIALAPAFEGYDRTWITAEGPAAEALRGRGERVICLPRFHGFSPKLATYAGKAAALVRRERPDFVVTSGSGSVAPFCAIARAGGAKLMFLETMARIENPSTGGRMLSKMAQRVVVQWPEMTEVYPGALVARPALLEERAEGARHDGEGTFVALGTHIDPFERMLRTVADAVDAGVLPGPIVAQTGVTQAEPRADLRAEAWMGPDELQAAVESARYVVCHSGSGLIARCLRAGRRPLVLPRLERFGEHVDDHQLQLVKKLGEMDCIVPLDGPITAEHLARADRPLPAASASELPGMAELVAAELERLRPSRVVRRLPDPLVAAEEPERLSA